ncbi:hypothetical protein LINPERPRIM_LOCUS16953 [Linum perenne]
MKENLLRRMCATSEICPCCNTERECWRQLLFHCHIPRRFWAKHFPSFSPPSQEEDFLSWFSRTTETHSNVVPVIAFAMWNLWKNQNAAVFKGMVPTLESVEAKLGFEVRMWDLASDQRNTPLISLGTNYTPMVHPPIRFRRKLMCDGSFIDDM